MMATHTHPTASGELRLPANNGVFYDGCWHAPISERWTDVVAPGTGARLMAVADAGMQDVARAASAARAGARLWRRTAPLARAAVLRKIAQRLRDNAKELALLDALDCGNPVSEMGSDVMVAAALLDFFAGLVTELKGDTIPMGHDALDYTEREPVGVVARIVAYNHPLLFAMGKLAAPLAAGNAVIIKPPVQAPLSALRCAELIADLLPPGVFSLVPGGAEAGAALAASPDVDMIGLVGSIATGRRVMQAAAARLKPVALELGGKNPFIACPDVDPTRVANAIVDGMNFTWCGQSCGSTSRAFVHRAIYDEVCAKVSQACAAFVPGDPTAPATTMGAMISREHRDRVKQAIDAAVMRGARLITGGGIPETGIPVGGFYLEPTVFADVAADSPLATEEFFGPVLALIPWDDEQEMLAAVHSLDVGLTAAIWTADLARAHRLAREIDAGFVWVNEIGKHFLGAPYGGVGQSGIGRDECIGEMVSFTREKNIHINFRTVSPA
ncbi:aldehyde dehydrogenase family protein [Achromobacter xylosoxidans]|uniref:aldehyde dehydrogenase family protein n=1 Tax=Alcaligenes xylosoxydans xylosoxydans TaxID=85698 RepID=UPI001F135955|nr:aldehyde dehydrogenase family protein [Achromobacter xylosoxidans]